MDTGQQALTNAGLPKISDVYGNLNGMINDTSGKLGSAANEATTANSGVAAANTQNQNNYASMPKVGDVYSNLEQQNGIPQLKAASQALSKNVTDLQNQIYRVTPNVSANDANSLVTESQRQGQVAAQEFPLEQALTPQATALGNINTEIGTAEQGIGNQVNAQNTANANTIQEGAQNISAAEDQAARSMSGFTTDQQNQLTLLNEKLAAGEALDNAEWQTLSTLATQKQGYDAAINQIKAKAQYTPTALGANGSVYYDSNGNPIYIGGGNSASSQGALGGSGGGYSVVQ